MRDEPKDLAPATGEFVLYVGDDGSLRVHVRISDGTVWLTQKLMAELYGKDVRTINEHLQNIYTEGELDPEATMLIHERADASKPHMGLATWKNAPGGPIRKNDVTLAKNYLTEQELSELNRVVTMYLDYAEDQARRRRPMTMADWVQKLDGFLQFNRTEHSHSRGQDQP